VKLDDAVETLIIDEVTRAVTAIGDGDTDSARQAIARIDIALLEHIRAEVLRAVSAATRPGGPKPQLVQRRRSVEREKYTVFRDDRWTCRFCGRRTVDPRVLRQLSVALPDAFPYHPNWKFGASHLLFWTHSTSLEHLVPLARGGADSRENFVTTCYACNDARSDFTLEELGWVLLPRTHDEWDGLTGHIPKLPRRAPRSRAVIPLPSSTAATPGATTTGPSTSNPQAGMLIRIAAPGRTQRRLHRVESVDIDGLTLREVWRSGGYWVYSERTIHVPAPTADEFEVAALNAPQHGDPLS
jgi:hypothetical protein